jgi:hypothetical protein
MKKTIDQITRQQPNHAHNSSGQKNRATQIFKRTSVRESN